MRARPNDIRDPSGAALSVRARVRRAVIGTFMGGVVLALIAVVLAAFLVGRRPGWWQPVNSADPGLDAVGTGVENMVAQEFSRVRPGATAPPAADQPWRSDEWTIEVTAEQAEAWLNSRLGKWLASRDAALPDGVRQIGIRFEEGRVRLGAAVSIGDGERVLSAVGSPQVGKDGGLWLRGVSVYAGRLPLPPTWISRGGGPDWLVRGLRDAPGFEHALKVLAGEAPLAERPVITLGDGRHVRLVSVEVHDGHLTATCRTEARAVSSGD